MKKSWWTTWGPLLLAAVLSFAASTDALSTENTRSTMALISDWLGIPRAFSGNFHHLVRKTIHFSEYAVLALLVFRSWRLACYPQPFLSVPALCLAWACLDEGHQRLTAQRQGTLEDVLLDLAGALAATLAVGLVRWLRSSNRRHAVG